MSDTIFAAATDYGETVTVFSAADTVGRDISAFFQLIGLGSGNDFRKPTKAGIANTAEYLLITPKTAFDDGESGIRIHRNGKIYRMIRKERIRCGQSEHWECILRESGADRNA